MAKRLHRFTHATTNDIQRLLSDAGKLTGHLEGAYERVYDACDICAATGQQKPRRKVSISHINTAFNDEIQADFVTVHIRGERYEVLNIIDTGTRYGERVIASTHSGEEIMRLLETEWIYHHGAPEAFSAEPEFCKGFFERFLSAHSIKLHARPSRSSSKNGKGERNNGVFKAVLARLALENTTASPSTLVARASFMTNLFHGSSTLSAFQLARGYSPSVLGIPWTIVPEELFNAHIEHAANRAVHRILRSRSPGTVRAENLTPGTRIWAFYKSSKHTEPVSWISASVVEAGAHVVKCRISRKGPPLMEAYEDIRLEPTGKLASELLKRSLDDELAEQDPDDDLETVDATPDSGTDHMTQLTDDTTKPCTETDRKANRSGDDAVMYEIFGSDDDACDNTPEKKASLLSSHTMG